MCICGLIRVIGFDHRKSVLSMVSCDPGCSGNVSFRVDLDKSSSTAAYEYFSTKLLLTESSDVSNLMLFIVICFSKLVHVMYFGNLRKLPCVGRGFILSFRSNDYKSIYDCVGCCLSGFLPGPLDRTWGEATPSSSRCASVSA